MDIYKCERAKYISVLEQTQGRITITTDMWIVENQRKAYITLDDYIFFFLFSFLEVSGSHTGQVLCDKLMSLLELNIECNLSSITIDIAASNDRMINFMLLALDKNDFIMSEKRFHIRCCAHILNLIIMDGLSVIGDLFVNIHECYFFVRID